MSVISMGKVHIGTVLGKKEKKLVYEMNSLTQHAAVLGTTGSGKTVMSKILIEEALQKGVPVIAIDPKGDIGSLAVVDSKFDFRPFVGNTLNKAEKVANQYYNALKEVQYKPEGLSKLGKMETRVFTPKSNVGIGVSLIPDLAAPAHFKKLSDKDPNIVADFVEPVSESVVQLAGITGAKRDKAQSLISSILLHNWEQQKNVDFKSLIEEIIKPPFETIGSLQLDDFMKENDRKAVASSVNLILSSPAKAAWKHGEGLDVAKMFSNGNLSVFDLRFAANNEEKQFVVEQILQNIYKFLVRKGGSQRLRYILYIDELAGLIPPPPSNPASKKLLELLIRQARAFGLGIIVATQSPGDIDYRIFGNIGTRLIGRLRTEKDLEKVATAMNLKLSTLKEDSSQLKTGYFVFNDAIRNTHKIMRARWLLSYHASPLKKEEIGWINKPETKPKSNGSVKLSLVKSSENSKKKKDSKDKKLKKQRKPKRITAKKIVKEILEPRKKRRKSKIRGSKEKKSREKPGIKAKSHKNLSALIKQIKKYADKTQLRVALSQHREYVPHLKIVVEPKPVKDITFSFQGPYVFDLTTRIIPIGNFVKHYNWSVFVSDDIVVAKHKISIEKMFNYTLKDAKDNIKGKFFQSTILNFISNDREEVEQNNYRYLMDEAKLKIRQLDAKESKQVDVVREKIGANKKKITKFSAKIKAFHTKRVLKKIFQGKKSNKGKKVPPEIKKYEKNTLVLKKENKKHEAKIKRIKEEFEDKKEHIRDKAYSRAHSCVKIFSYNPQRKDMIVHASLLLIPKRRGHI